MANFASPSLTTPTAPPVAVQPRLLKAFLWYARRYVARHFHALRVAGDGRLPDLPRGPLVVVMNHPSWWDPMIGLAIISEMPSWRRHFGPIDVAGLAQYPFLGKIGFFGVEPGTARGGIQFLRRSLEILASPESTLWITAQGRFVDARDRPVRLREGIGHLARRMRGGWILPMAVEYPFWDDRCPEALARFGQPIEVSERPALSSGAWTARIEAALEENQDALATLARRRDPSAFETIVAGTAGVGGVYDMWRRVRARLRGEHFRPEHRGTKRPRA
ncbi:lysophospholipid acyltransferase family protein [Aquisphaera giovannonii]|uniref:lysophospholipid acyltransferase family protein n=1 Tax=Aquisphaera giovannonii TaxID=406548 RepID=UPI00143DBE0D|nr:lysophospholipid acyltransferase family protein [Aquisphaera giovannonii]